MNETLAEEATDLGGAVVGLAAALARSAPGPLAELRRMDPGQGAPAFWQLYYQLRLDRQTGDDAGWEWVAQALALLTPTGRDPAKLSTHDGHVPLGRALHAAGVGELRMAAVLNAPLPQRRVALIRLVRMLARDQARLDTRDLARLLLFANADVRNPQNPLRRLAQSYYAAAAVKEGENENA